MRKQSLSTLKLTKSVPIGAAKRELSRSLLQNEGISGVGIVSTEGGREGIKVYLRDDSPQVRSLVPDSVAGYPVVIETIGTIRATT